MKKILFLLLCPSFLFAQTKEDTPPPPIEAPVVPHESDEKMGLEWQTIFTHLVQQQQWLQASFIAHIGEEHFSNQTFWTKQSFQTTWSAYQFNNALRFWTFQPLGMFRNADKEGVEAVVGFQREMDGSWWLVMQSQTGWTCGTPCVVRVETPTRSVNLTARMPVGETSSKSLGMSLPVSLISNQSQQWIIHPPSGDKVVMDVSYARSICQHKLLQCF